MAPGRRLALLPPLAFALAAPLLGQQGTQESRVYLGSARALIQELAAREGEATSLQMKEGRLAIHVSHASVREDGVSISGTAIGAARSTFFLKGTPAALKGHLVNYDTERAWEYATDAGGRVYVVEVPFAKVVPCLDPGWLRATDLHFRQTLATVLHPAYSPMALHQAPHIGPYANQDVRTLESRPGSPYVFYLNISAVMSGDTPLNGVTKENMYRMWQGVADHYSAYNLNVTTSLSVYNAAKAANVNRTGIINFVNEDGRSNAPIGAFGTTSAGTVYRNPASGYDYGYGIGLTAAHEVGHEMGMSHDHGGSGGEYFEGIAAYQWGPIMGNYWMGANWANGFWTWSKGEYDTATNFEDDLRIMNVDEAVPYIPDDNVSGKPLAVDASGTISPSGNFGQIERTGDTDVFTFSLASDGKLNLKIDPIEYLHMLDVDATITTAGGTPVAHSNLSVNRGAQFVDLALAAGDYKLVITGGAEGTPQNGFSNYSSIGWYAMQGTLTGGTPAAPTLTQQPQSVSVAAGQTATFTVKATGSAPLSYQWLRNGTALSGGTSATYATPPTTMADNGAVFTVRVANSLGTATSAPATLTVTNTATELVKNGTFEAGTANWSETAACITNNTGNRPYQGSYYAWMGGNGRTSTEEVSQVLALPAGGTPILSFYLKITTAETEAVAYDTLKVRVLDASTGALLATLATYSNLDKSTAYAKRSFDLSAYRGKSVKVDFLMNEDASLQTTFLVDNVSVTVP